MVIEPFCYWKQPFPVIVYYTTLCRYWHTLRMAVSINYIGTITSKSLPRILQIFRFICPVMNVIFGLIIFRCDQQNIFLIYATLNLTLTQSAKRGIIWVMG